MYFSRGHSASESTVRNMKACLGKLTKPINRQPLEEITADLRALLINPLCKNLLMEPFCNLKDKPEDLKRHINEYIYQ